MANCRIRSLHFVSLLAVIIVFGGLSGCASPAKTKAMVATIPVQKGHPYSVRVYTHGGSETGAIDSSNISTEDFAKAIEESIVENKVFSGVVHEGNSDYELNVTIVELSKPIFGGSFTVTMETAWSLVNVKTRKVAMKKGIKSSYTATMGQAFAGMTRLRLAVEGAAKENIRKGLQAISELQLE